jgi:hypothetical protein
MASHRESDDDYSNVIAQLGPTHRVIVCKDNIQWIVQRRKDSWRSLHYLTSRDGVLRRLKGLPGWEALNALSDHFHPARAGGKPSWAAFPSRWVATPAHENALGGGLK